MSAIALTLLALGLTVALLISRRRQLQAHRKLAATEQRWLAALDGAGHGVWDWDAREQKAYFSRRWKEMLGYGEDEIGTGFEEWTGRLHPEDRQHATEAFARYLKGDTELYSVMHRLRAKDGSYLWVLGRGMAIERDAKGEVLRIIGTNTDLTRYRHAEIALAEKERLYLALVEQAPDGMALIDPETQQFVQFNRAMHEKLGYSQDEFRTLRIGDIDALDTLAEQQAKIQEIHRRGACIFDTQHRHKDGSLRDVRVSARCVTQNGKPFVAVVFKDLTDLRQAERARLLSQQDFEATFDQVAVGMAHIALDGHYLRVNTKLARMLGCTAADLCQRRFQDMTHPDDVDENLALVERLRAGEIASFQFEKRYLRRDGTMIWTLVTMSLVRAEDGAPAYFISVIEDINERKAAEEQLHVAAQMIDLAAFAIVATDMQGVIRQFNPAAERLLGYRAAEMIGRQTPLCFHFDSEIRARAHELTAQLGEEVPPGFDIFRLPVLRDGEETREWTLRRRDGQPLSALLSVTALRDSTGKPRGLLGNIVDVSPLRQATEALRRERDHAQRTLDTVNAIILSLDAQGRITLANRYTCELLGHPEQELLGQDWFARFVPAEDAHRLRPAFAQLLAGEPLDNGVIESEVRCPDGSRRLIAWRNSPLRDDSGQVCGVLSAGNDITEKRAMESARDQALAEAERLANLKNAFLANMSHEIRTPLNGILGLAEIGRRDFDTQEAGRLFRHIQNAGQHLLVLLNDILDFSRIQAGKLRIRNKAFSLGECLAEIASMLSPLAEAKGLTLHVQTAPDLPAWVLGDPMRLRQILLNLLGNAIKFTQVGSVRLVVAPLEEALLFEVTDTGIGMNTSEIARIFEPFEQANASITRAQGGTGLGLPISQALAQRMGGSLSVTSEPKVGSCFKLHLPLREATPPRAAAARATGDASDARILVGLHILIVDDVALNLLVLEDLLSHAGAHVTSARDGQEALNKLATAGAEPCDLVLMDVQMPVMDGYEATRRIHAQHPNLPVIGLTAHAMHEERDRCLAAGMVARLTKPIDLKVLIATIQHWRQNSPGTMAAAAPSADGSANNDETATAASARAPTLIDWDSLHQRFAHSPGFIEHLLQTALSSQQETPARLRALAEAGDIQEFFRLTHSLKGFAGNLAAKPLHQQADRLCEQARAGDPAALAGAESLAKTLEEVLDALVGHLHP